MEDKIKQFLKTIKMNESVLSMFFGVVTVILVGILVFRIYNANRPQISKEGDATTKPSTAMVGDVKVEVQEDGTKVPAELPDKYTVQAGDHLWRIAEAQYGSGYNWVDIAKENKLQNPSVIVAGQELKLPKVAVKEVGTPKTTAVANQIEGDSYTVIKGDHLWGIAVRAYGDGYKWPEIAKANNISTPNYIEIGQKLKLPR